MRIQILSPPSPKTLRNLPHLHHRTGNHRSLVTLSKPRKHARRNVMNATLRRLMRKQRREQHERKLKLDELSGRSDDNRRLLKRQNELPVPQLFCPPKTPM